MSNRNWVTVMVFMAAFIFHLANNQRRQRDANLASWLWAQHGDSECAGIDISMPSCYLSAQPDSIQEPWKEWATEILETR